MNLKTVLDMIALDMSEVACEKQKGEMLGPRALERLQEFVYICPVCEWGPAMPVALE